MNLFEKDVMTTGEVAKICNVASRTVSKWFDSGQLRGYRIPGSKDRRIPVANLIKFMKANRDMQVTVARMGDSNFYTLIGFRVRTSKGMASGSALEFSTR